MMTDNLRSLTGKYQDLEESYSELYVANHDILSTTSPIRVPNYQTTNAKKEGENSC